MKLTVANRTAGKKSEIKNIRREGNIPAVLYSQGKKGKEFVVDGAEFRKFLNTLEPGTLSSKIFTLEIGGKAARAIIKDIQYDVTTYNIMHLDFAELHEEVEVTLNIPVKCINAVVCTGVKEGGVLRQVIRQMKVNCLPKNIPSHFELDVQNLGLGQALKLKDISIPDNVRPVVELKQIAVIVARR